jgi:hypothetical protein
MGGTNGPRYTLVGGLGESDDDVIDRVVPWAAAAWLLTPGWRPEPSKGAYELTGQVTSHYSLGLAMIGRCGVNVSDVGGRKRARGKEASHPAR